MSEYLKKIYSFFFDTAQTVLIAASIFLVIYLFIMRPFEVSGESMYPTYENGEYILTNLITLKFSAPKKGDVIVFASPVDDKDYIKRIIADEGDSVKIEDGKVYVNGKFLDESSYLSASVETSGGQELTEGQNYTVPEGHIAVMGDNRPHSSDSREWGFLKKSDVIGKSFFVYWPLQNARAVKNPFLN